MVGSIAANQSICYNTTPAQLTGTAPTGGNTPYTYQWQSSADNVTFTDITGATNLNYQPGALIQTTYYRLNQSSASGCGTVTTNTITITVYGNLVAGTIATSQSICYNTAPALLTGTAPTGGNTPYTYQWQNSTDNVTFTNITGATSLTYQPGALTQTTYYRLNQTSASGCGTVTTNTVTITVYPNLVAGSISASQSICYNTAPAQLTGVPPTGGNTPYTYQWQNSPDGTTWTNISGATSLNYQPPVLTATTWYRLNQTSASGCGTVTTNSVTITVYANFVAGTIAASQSICYNTAPTLLTGTAPTGGTTPYTYQWQSSPNGTTWANITGATGLTYQPGVLTATTHYRLNQTSASGCGTVTTNTVTVTINPLPVPTITGPTLCGVGTTGNIYTTETGMTGYNWTVSAGGTIASGQGTNSISVTWNTAGAQTVCVNYINSNGCTAASATCLNVEVITYPSPAGPITGTAVVCQNTNGVAYSVAPITNATGYVWTLPPGATIATGANTDSITVNYSTTAISGDITVYGTNSFGNGAPSPPFAVTVNPMPSPTITGQSTVCAGISGVVYITQPGMTGYTWVVSGGGIITAGSGTNAITVTWNTAGAQTVSVNYTNGNGCTAATPTVYNVTVNPLPVPTITGTASVCVNSSGNVYSTQTGMTNYNWSITPGGWIITSGSGSSAITVTWTSVGTKTISVNYTNSNGCTGATPGTFAVTVNALPTPTITGPAAVCAGSTGNIYTTEAGMTGYTWSVSAGGTITAGAGTNAITVTWNSTGYNVVTVNYTNANGCTAPIPTNYTVIVNALPSPTINGNFSPCVGPEYVDYYTESGMTGYVWTVSSGGSIYSGQGTYHLRVIWNTAGMQSLGVNYYNSAGCTLPAPYTATIFVNPLPDAAGTITGTGTVCAGQQGVAYSTTSVQNATSYTWYLPAGATIATGAGTTSITVNFGTNAVSGDITVAGTNECGNGPLSPPFPVTVNPLPAAAGTITGSDTVCQGDQGVSYNVPSIAHATGYTWSAPPGATIASGGNTNHITVNFSETASSGVITVYGSNSCGDGAVSPEFSVIVEICTGIRENEEVFLSIFPNPSNGIVTVSIQSLKPDDFSLQVFNTIGGLIFEAKDLHVKGSIQKTVDLRPAPTGMYNFVLMNKNHYSTTKVILQN